jgi:hypothetical protein
MSEKMIFCFGDGKYERKGEGYQKNFRAWNKPISEKHYEEILGELQKILSDIKLDARKDWVAEWGRVSASQWKKIAAIPEFDLEITKKITGLSEIPSSSSNENQKKARELRKHADILLEKAKELESSPSSDSPLQPMKKLVKKIEATTKNLSKL